MTLFETKTGFEAEAAELCREKQELWYYGSEEAYEEEVRRMRHEVIARDSATTIPNMDFSEQKDVCCNVCRSNYLCRDTRQMRKGDEGMGVFYTCGKCGAQTIKHD